LFFTFAGRTSFSTDNTEGLIPSHLPAHTLAATSNAFFLSALVNFAGSSRSTADSLSASLLRTVTATSFASLDLKWVFVSTRMQSEQLLEHTQPPSIHFFRIGKAELFPPETGDVFSQ